MSAGEKVGYRGGRIAIWIWDKDVAGQKCGDTGKFGEIW